MPVARSVWGSWVFIIYTGLTQAAPVTVTETFKEKAQDESANIVFQFDNPLHQSILNAPTKPVEKLPNPDVDLLIQNMLQVMRKKSGGAGISANQLGRPLQISVVGDPLAFDAEAPYTVYINPVITRVSQLTSCFWHGCLSSEGKKFGRVSTWQKITVTALDQEGNEFTKELDKLDAIVFQHEFRHLLGGGYHEHASDFKEESELMKLALSGKLKFVEPCQSGEKPLLEDYIIGETIEAYSKRKDKKEKETKPLKQNDSSEKKH